MSAYLVASSWESDKEVLKDILEGKEYEAYRNSGAGDGSWLSYLWDQLIRLLSKLLPDHAIPQSAADIVSYLVIIAGILLLLALVIWIARRISFDRRLGHSLRLSQEELKLGYGDYLRKASEAHQAGERKEAIRLTFLSLLFYAHYREWIRAESWKANGEYVWELKRNKQELLPLFLDSSHLFERVFYGGEEASEDEFLSMYTRVESWIRGEEGQVDEQQRQSV